MGGRKGVVGVSASVNLPLHHKIQNFCSGTGSPGWSRKKGRKTVVVCLCVCMTLTFPDVLSYVFDQPISKAFDLLIIVTSPRERLRSIVMTASVCLSVCPTEPHTPRLPIFVNVAYVRGSVLLRQVYDRPHRRERILFPTVKAL